jgi:dCTP deaminase
MGWLTGNEIDREVKGGRILIDEYFEEHLNSNSYNYRLANHLRRMTNEVIDCAAEDIFEDLVIPESGLRLEPGECYLGMTAERFGSNEYASLITGRSSVGRKFMTNHICAGLIDQGFFGRITLEIMVAKPTIVYPMMRFGQIFWFSTDGRFRPYAGKYQDQDSPTASMLHLDRSD